MFYFNDTTDKHTTFNLPKGKYYTSNTIKETQPRKYALPNLPPRERKMKMPNHVDIKYGDNPNKASIWLEQRIILLDNAIKRLSKPQIIQIIYHEFGHYYYTTEKYCDLFAARRMLVEGYNPKQIFFSIAGALNDTESSQERKEYILQNCESAFK